MIQELIDTFEELKKKKYFIDMGKGGLILIEFNDENFYHLAGLHKVDLSIYLPKGCISKEKQYRYIKTHVNKFEKVLLNKIKENRLLTQRIKTFKYIPDIFKNVELNISPKLDGLTAVCYYKNCKLDCAVTRGNGKVGLDITNKLKIILSKNNINLPDNFTGAVRGELEISKSNWEIIKSINENATNSRNYAAGIINRNELSDDLKYVDLVTYKILGSENHKFNTKLEVVEFLKKSGFDTIWNIQYNINNKENWEKYSKELYTQEYQYQLDGLVLSRNPKKW